MGHIHSGNPKHEECSGEVQREKKTEVIFLAEIVIVLFILVFCFQQRVEAPALEVIPTESPAPSPTMTPSPSPSPSPTMTPSPTPSPIPEGKQVDSGHTFKPYTSFRAYNLKGSAQHSLQQVSKTAENGIRIAVDPFGIERYCVALGTFWAGGHPQDIGRCLDVYMVNGAVLHCCLADVKQEKHTKGNKYGKTNNDLLEFVVDERSLTNAVRDCGNVSKTGAEFEGDAWQIVVLDYFIDGFGEEWKR